MEGKNAFRILYIAENHHKVYFMKITSVFMFRIIYLRSVGRIWSVEVQLKSLKLMMLHSLVGAGHNVTM